VTTFLLVSAALALVALTRHITLVTVAYLALRHSPPDKRSEILHALGPVLTAVHPMSPDVGPNVGDRATTGRTRSKKRRRHR
jgi:hypothetical protein